MAIPLAGLSACAGHPAAELPLNSERIEARFGSYGVRVLTQSENERRSCLYSIEGGREVCRTLALVLFPDEPRLAREMERVRLGASLGSTLRDSGYELGKTNRYLGTMQSPDATARIAALFGPPAPSSLALHVYDLDAFVDGRRAPVATILEVHHPDYLTGADLERLYGDLPSRALASATLGDWQRRLGDWP